MRGVLIGSTLAGVGVLVWLVALGGSDWIAREAASYQRDFQNQMALGQPVTANQHLENILTVPFVVMCCNLQPKPMTTMPGHRVRCRNHNCAIATADCASVRNWITSRGR